MKVKNCPLKCKGEASYDNLYMEGHRPLHKVECHECGCNITGETFKVVDQWNDRAESDPVPPCECDVCDTDCDCDCHASSLREEVEDLEIENNFLKGPNCS